jgi:putative transposase
MGERGVNVDHATLNRWVIDYSPLLAAEAKKRKRAVATSCRMDETYVKVKGQWVYLYRAVNNNGFPIKSSWIKAAQTMWTLTISIGY